MLKIFKIIIIIITLFYVVYLYKSVSFVNLILNIQFQIIEI